MAKSSLLPIVLLAGGAVALIAMSGGGGGGGGGGGKEMALTKVSPNYLLLDGTVIKNASNPALEGAGMPDASIYKHNAVIILNGSSAMAMANGSIKQAASMMPNVFFMAANFQSVLAQIEYVLNEMSKELLISPDKKSEVRKKLNQARSQIPPDLALLGVSSSGSPMDFSRLENVPLNQGPSGEFSILGDSAEQIVAKVNKQIAMLPSGVVTTRQAVSYQFDPMSDIIQRVDRFGLLRLV